MATTATAVKTGEFTKLTNALDVTTDTEFALSAKAG
jgi:hypothetical protein